MAHIDSIRRLCKADPLPSEFDGLSGTTEEASVAKGIINELNSFVNDKVLPYAEKVRGASTASCLDITKQLELKTTVPQNKLPQPPPSDTFFLFAPRLGDIPRSRLPIRPTEQKGGPTHRLYSLGLGSVNHPGVRSIIRFKLSRRGREKKLHALQSMSSRTRRDAFKMTG